MSICPNCNKKIKGSNKKKKGDIWRHTECDKEARKVFQKKKKEKYLDNVRLKRLAKSRGKDLKNSVKNEE